MAEILLIFKSCTGCILSIRKEFISDKDKVKDSDQKHRNSNRRIHKEACGKSHLLKCIHTHQVSGCTDNRKVSAKCCGKYQRHQKTASGIAGLIGDSTDYRDQHCCSTCIG